MSNDMERSFTLESEDPRTWTKKTAIEFITLEDGTKAPFDEFRLRQLITEATIGFSAGEVDSSLIIDESLRNLFEGMPQKSLMQAAIMASRSFIELDQAYSFVT